MWPQEDYMYGISYFSLKVVVDCILAAGYTLNVFLKCKGRNVHILDITYNEEMRPVLSQPYKCEKPDDINIDFTNSFPAKYVESTAKKILIVTYILKSPR